uniref:SGNH hydrolase-type esterase domain-containing protein n=1 Tax=Gasterosteus aculeatus aculeatus TaxID=481459 RepID=A0AAQ4NT99_GASAC
MKKLEDSVQGNKSTSDNPPWTTLGAKPKRRPDKGERITGRTQRPDICDLQRTTEKRGTTKKPPQQTGVKLQNRFAPLLQDHGSPSKCLDNPPPPRSRVRPANLKPQRKLTTGPENLIVGDFSVKDMKSSNDTKVLCFPEDMVSDLEERILEIVAEHPTVKNLILHIGSNDIEKQQSEKLKEHFDNLLETVSSVNAEVFISGPLPPTGRGAERFSRLFWLNKWLLTACAVRSMHCINNFSFFSDRRHLFKTNGLCLNKMGANSKSTPKPVNNTIRMALLNVRSLNNKSMILLNYCPAFLPTLTV